MIKLFSLRNCDVHERLTELLSQHIPAPIEILRTENGKPYVAGNPIYFSLTHSGNRSMIALGDKPIGVDLELYGPREFPHILSRFSERERAEISDGRLFLLHWTAREAFVKMKGATLAEMLNKLEFFGGELFCCGAKQRCRLQFYRFDFGVAALCTEE